MIQSWTIQKATILIAFLILLVSIVYASLQISLWKEFPQLWELIWFRITLIDFYIGIGIFAAWVIYRETNGLVSFGWIVAFVLLGNLATLLYLFLAFQKLGPNQTLDQFFHGAH